VDARSQLLNMAHRGRLTLISPRLAGASIWRAHVHATGEHLEAPSPELLLDLIHARLKEATHAPSL
jgi:hypothetical protein